MKQAVKRVLSRYVPVLVYLALAFMLFQNATSAARDFSQISLRYTDNPLSAAQVSTAKTYLHNPKITPEFIPSFWAQQQKVTLKSDVITKDTAALLIDGEMAPAMPVEFVEGTYPGMDDKVGIAISEEVAWALWGGSSVVGFEVEWNTRQYVVRGVFQGKDPMVLLQVDAGRLDKDFIFEGVELVGETKLNPQEAAKSFAQTIGLPAPDTIVNGSGLASLLSMAAWLPASILILWFLVRLLKVVHRLSYWSKQVFWLAVLLGVAFGIPALLDLLPGFLVPTKWSDLTFWSDVGKQISARATEWLLLVPSLKDLMLKRLMIWQAILLYPSLVAAIIMIQRWDARLSRAFSGPMPEEKITPKPETDTEQTGEIAGHSDEDFSLPRLPQEDAKRETPPADTSNAQPEEGAPPLEVPPAKTAEDEDEAPPRPQRRSTAKKAPAKTATPDALAEDSSEHQQQEATQAPASEEFGYDGDFISR